MFNIAGFLKFLTVNDNNATRRLSETSKIPSLSEAIVHLNTYLAEPLIGIQEDPIKYWLDYTGSSELKEIALEYLIVTGTSVPSESTFSGAGYTLNCRRSRLTPEHAHQILFLKENLKFIE